MRYWTIGLIAAFGVSLQVESTVRAAVGQVINLGTFGGSRSTAYGINDSGIVVGAARNSSEVDRAFSYSITSGGALANTGTLGGSGSVAFGVNSSGLIVGYSDLPGNQNFRAFSVPNTTAATLRNLGTLPGGINSLAGRVNDSGVIVGRSYSSSIEYHAVVHPGTSGGLMQDLGTLGGSISSATSINASGQIVGWARYSQFSTGVHAFKHPGTVGGTMQDLGTLGADSLASDVNTAGKVVGYSIIGTAHAFKHDGNVSDVMVNLGTLPGGTSSAANAINDSDVAVGYANVPGGSFHAALWKPDNRIVDLDAWLDLVNPTQGQYWTLTLANDINSDGWIVGEGEYNDGPGGLTDGTRAFAINAAAAVPEPTTSAFAVLTIISLFRRRDRAKRMGR